jgi:hypothetical protein
LRTEQPDMAAQQRDGDKECVTRPSLEAGKPSTTRRRDEISDFYFFTPRSAVPIAEVGAINKRLGVIRTRSIEIRWKFAAHDFRLFL